ncbi:MAG: hypothetical protein KIT85_13005 [Pseudolabrys sp.]|nr:hypothetical protein [Pseudolabrys sp.]MCW5685320.1 hypothetical protein [Pseudolabrys sp.]
MAGPVIAPVIAALPIATAAMKAQADRDGRRITNLAKLPAEFPLYQRPPDAKVAPLLSLRRRAGRRRGRNLAKMRKGPVNNPRFGAISGDISGKTGP